MRVVILPSARLASRTVARVVAEALTATPDLALGLPTGQTPILVYDELVGLAARGRASFRRATVFNLDEFAGMSGRDPRSYHAFLQHRLFARLRRAPARCVMLRGDAPDWRAETRRFDRAIARAGGLDLCLLGIGRNGHLGFNEPAPALVAGTHRVRLTTATRQSNAYLFDGRWQDVPRFALSMGIGNLLGARRVVLLATGPQKAGIVARALAGPVTPWVPASLLQAHPDALVVLDRDAARIFLSRGSISSPSASRIESSAPRRRRTARA